jgi:transketolase
MKKYTDRGKKDTRSGFGAGLLEAGKADSRVVALTADLKAHLKWGISLTSFQRDTSSAASLKRTCRVAAGMAIAGKIPFVGSFAEFVTGAFTISPHGGLLRQDQRENRIFPCWNHAGEDGATHQRWKT